MELQQWGWNPITIGFVGTLVFIFVRAWGYWYQTKKIWTERSGQSVSVTAFIYMAGANCCGLTYGIAIDSFALIINGLMTLLLLLPILSGLWKFKGFDRKEWMLCVFLLGAVVALVLSPFKDVIFLASMLGMIASAWLIPWEIFRNRDAGVVEIRMLFAGFMNASFWLVYAIAIGNWVLMLINPLILVSIVVTITLWWKYRRVSTPRTAV